MRSKNSIYTNIRRLRENKNYTQKYVADMLGIDKASMSRIESGSVDIPVSRLIAIAKFHGVSVSSILCEDVKSATAEKTEAVLQIRLSNQEKDQVFNMIFGKQDVELLNK